MKPVDLTTVLVQNLRSTTHTVVRSQYTHLFYANYFNIWIHNFTF